jgi:hypothetical protein
MASVARALAVLALLAALSVASADESGPTEPGIDSCPPIVCGS